MTAIYGDNRTKLLLSTQLKNPHHQFESPHDKTNKMTVPREDSDQPGPPSLIRVFAVHSVGS